MGISIFHDIKAIMACDPKGVMGREGKLPWDYPEELAHFAETTNGHIIVMGASTYESMPRSYLEERLGIVFTHDLQAFEPSTNPLIVSSVDEFLSLESLPEGKECFVIGGAEICRLFLRENLIRTLILTIIKKEYEGDTFFPLDMIGSWPRKLVRDSGDFAIYHYTNPEKD